MTCKMGLIGETNYQTRGLPSAMVTGPDQIRGSVGARLAPRGAAASIWRHQTKNRTMFQKKGTKLQDNHNVFNEGLLENAAFMKGHYTIAEVESAGTKPNWEAHPLCSPIFQGPGNAVEF